MSTGVKYEIIRRYGAPPSFELIKRGKWCNANVYRFEVDGRLLILKDFHSCPAMARETIGRLLCHREAKTLTRLAGSPGVPTGVQRVGSYALIMDYVQGRSLSALCRGKARLPKAFFEEMETRVAAIHQRGFVHLDLRNLGNTICGDDGKPYIIDFQSCVRIKLLPGIIRRKLQDIDYSGVYKGWSRACAEELDEPRATRKASVDATRRLWIFKGYWLSKTWSHVAGRCAGAISHLKTLRNDVNLSIRIRSRHHHH